MIVVSGSHCRSMMWLAAVVIVADVVDVILLMGLFIF